MSLSAVARNIFLTALESVKPEKLIRDAVRCHGDVLHVNGKKYLMKKNVFVLGFGKAVYGMVVGLHAILKDHIAGGYISVPHELNFEPTSKSLDGMSKIQVKPGARNNLPDTAAMHNAINIKTIINSLAPDDIAIILISGGGSALLPLPVSNLSLDDKLECIKVIANAGGSIQQLNVIRKKLSQTKGGKLLSSCLSTSIISLIISDIVNNPLDLIASGPTVADTSTVDECMKIFRDLNVDKDIPPVVLDYLRSNADILQNNANIIQNGGVQCCNNVLIGSNSILVSRTCGIAEEQGYKPYVITTQLECDAENAGIELAEIAVLFLESNNSEELVKRLRELNKDIKRNDIDELLNVNKICLIMAGETTVKVKGSGRGGRNQHLILSALNRLKKISVENKSIDLNKLCFLSAGTDGQDGATDVAGAMCDGNSINKAITMELDTEGYLSNCASYDFFTTYSFLNCSIKTGLTGTNVMDIQIALIDKGLV